MSFRCRILGSHSASQPLCYHSITSEELQKNKTESVWYWDHDPMGSWENAAVAMLDGVERSHLSENESTVWGKKHISLKRDFKMFKMAQHNHIEEVWKTVIMKMLPLTSKLLSRHTHTHSPCLISSLDPDMLFICKTPCSPGSPC